jgi:hypothetical protein
MSNILKIACGWRRKENWHRNGLKPETSSVTYAPENIGVQYRNNKDNQPVVENILVFSNAYTRFVIKKLTDIPADMYQTVAKLVQDNERSYGRFIHSVILPNGEIAHV